MQCNVELIACGREMQADVTGGAHVGGAWGLPPPPPTPLPFLPLKCGCKAP